MLSFVYEDGKLVRVSSEYERDAINRNDMTCMDTAKTIAAHATTLTGYLHIAVDRGNHTSPRYDVIEAPRVGAEVSRAFNGDYYPAGKIVRVSPSLKRVTTDIGVVFTRRGESGTWLNHGMWAMVPGTIDKRNPSF